MKTFSFHENVPPKAIVEEVINLQTLLFRTTYGTTGCTQKWLLKLGTQRSMYLYVTGCTYTSIVSANCYWCMLYKLYTSVSTGTMREASSCMLLFYEKPPTHISLANDCTMVSYSHLFLKVDVCLCWEQMMHNFTMIFPTCDVQRRFPILEVKNGIAHVKCTCRGTRLTSW